MIDRSHVTLETAFLSANSTVFADFVTVILCPFSYFTGSFHCHNVCASLFSQIKSHPDSCSPFLSLPLTPYLTLNIT
jgi:hypothetical protein